MATMPSSGTISSANLQSVFGSDSSFSSADYYRGGSFVPSTKLIPGYEYFGTWSSWAFKYPVTDFVNTFRSYNSATGVFEWWWEDTRLASMSSSTQYVTTGGYQYERGAFREQISTTFYYEIRRRTITYVPPQVVDINTGVPTSGVITSSNWYGAESA